MGRKKEQPVTQKLKAVGRSEVVQEIESPKKQTVTRSSRVRNISSNVSEMSSKMATRSKSSAVISDTSKSKQVISDLSPKMFYSKRRPTRSAKPVPEDTSVSSNDLNSIDQPKKTFPLTDSSNIPIEEADGDTGGICPKLFYSRTRKGAQSGQSVPQVPSKKSKVTEKLVGSRCTRTRQGSDELLTEQMITELTDDPKDIKLLPVNEVLESIVNGVRTTRRTGATKQTRSSKLKTNACEVSSVTSRSRKNSTEAMEPSQEASPSSPTQTKTSVPKRKPPHNPVLTIAEIVAEVSTEGVSAFRSSTAADNKTSDSQNKKVSSSADGECIKSVVSSEDLDSTKNVYDFEEFQVGSSAAPTSKSASRKSSNSEVYSSAEKKLSVKKMAAMKAVFNNKKKKISVGSVKKPRVRKAPKVLKSNKNLHKRTVSKTISVSRSSNSSVESKAIADKMSVTPEDQLLCDAASFREIEKEKAKKHSANKIVSKINPAPTVAASIWPDLDLIATTKFTQLKRSPMEGPQSKHVMKIQNQPVLPKYQASTAKRIDQRPCADKPESTTSSSGKEQVVVCDPPFLGLNEPAPVGDTENHIDLFTYPVVPSKKKKSKTDQSKENKVTPEKGFMDFLHAGSMKRYLKPLKKPEPENTLNSPPAVMLPKFLTAGTSTPNTQNSAVSKTFGTDSLCISPVKDFQSPASMRTYANTSRRSSLQSIFIANIADEIGTQGDNVQQEKTKKGKSKEKQKKAFRKNGEMEIWAERMSNEFDEIENFELSIEG
ncbi:uncharacterized protein LOC115213237 [Argonauta hians]